MTPVKVLALAGCGKKEVFETAQNPEVNDFKDGPEYYIALHAGCGCIITGNTNGFYFSEIEILPVAAFLRKYALWFLCLYDQEKLISFSNHATLSIFQYLCAQKFQSIF